ncbi:hypothetical protein IMSAGC013_01980 [Lachnospiraceae bacterium]|nr:hypothetical protein IMSAGC013_01980 [Lachnospiraceae bacterium]
MEINFQFQDVFRIASVHKSQILRKYLIENKTSQGGFHIAGYFFSSRHCLCHTYSNSGMQRQGIIFISQNCLVYILEKFPFAFCPRPFLGQIINSQHHILRRHCHRPAVGRLQQVIGRQQQKPALRLGFHRQRKVNRHLVSVKVCVKGGTYQRMQLDSLALYQNRLKCLNSKSVQRGSTV